MVWILLLIGLCIGLAMAGESGAVFGAISGYLIGSVIELRTKLGDTTKKLTDLTEHFTQLSQHYEKNQFLRQKDSRHEPVTKEESLEAASTELQPALQPEIQPDPEAPKIAALKTNSQETKTTTSTPESATDFVSEDISNTDNVIAQPAKKEPVINEPIMASNTATNSAVDNKQQASKSIPKPSPKKPAKTEPNFIVKFFTEGNPIIKVASLVLFTGLAFLLKYAADNSMVSIETRFIGVTVTAIGFLVWGLFLRKKRPDVGLVVQGLAIGTLYLTTYSAAAFYNLIPLNIAFYCLFGITILGAILAIKQDSSVLAAVAIIGGFLAPILTSSGSNAYIQLFSYYAALNLGILIISWFKSWRYLNWIGFAFTFLVGTAWGLESYGHSYFATTEPFLIFHFLLYLSIPIIFLYRAARAKDKKEKPLHATVQAGIVFGLPTISFAMQMQMVERIVHGYTLSALGWALAYFVGCFIIRAINKKQENPDNTLFSCYLAIALSFVSLAIFFYFRTNITAVLWALQAIALVWIGLRQKQFIPRFIGLGLWGVSLLLFMHHYNHEAGQYIFFSTNFLVLVSLAAAALLIGFQYQRHYYGEQKSSSQDLASNSNANIISNTFTNLELIAPIPLAIVGAFILYIAGFLEVDSNKLGNLSEAIYIIYSAVIGLALYTASKWLKWSFVKILSLLTPAITLLMLLSHFYQDQGQLPISGIYALAYPLGFATSFFLLKTNQEKLDNIWKPASVILHTAINLGVVFVITWTLALAAQSLMSHAVWYSLVFGLIPAVALLGLLKISQGNKKWLFSHAAFATSASLAIYAVGYILSNMLLDLHPDNIVFAPILNPKTLIMLLMIFAIYKFIKTYKPFGSEYTKLTNIVFLLVLFAALNIEIARSFHHYMGVPYDTYNLFNNGTFQTTLTIIWSLVAIVIMLLSKSRKSRPLWITGAALLCVILLKLIGVDMSESGTLSRIISFLGVGGVMLAIGYFVPMPPSNDESKQTETQE